MTALLIVEDDPAIGCALEDDLRLEGYDVTLVTDGDSAVERALQRRFSSSSWMSCSRGRMDSRCAESYVARA